MAMSFEALSAIVRLGAMACVVGMGSGLGLGSDLDLDLGVVMAFAHPFGLAYLRRQQS